MRKPAFCAVAMITGLLAAAGCGSATAPASAGQHAATRTSSSLTCTRPRLTGPGRTLTVTEKDNGKSYCLSVGTGIFVFLHGAPAAMWSAIRSDSAVVAPQASGVMTLMRGVTGAHFVVTGRGRADITALRPPCHQGGTPASCPASDRFRVLVLIEGLPGT